MSIIYKPRKHVSIVSGKEKIGYFAGKVPGRTLETDKLCHRISDKCSLTSADVKAAIEALVTELTSEFRLGGSVRVGDLGIFSTSITSEVVDTQEDLKPKKVSVKTISFLPSVRLKEMMKEVEFMRLRDFDRMVQEMEDYE